MARWVQLGCFSPYLRLHSSDSPFNTREPWAFSNECYDVCSKFLRFRHRLVPYLYTANIHTSQTFKALVEPMYYDYPEQAEAYQYRNQFSFGSEMIVFPVVSRSGDVTKLGSTTGWLPAGRWVDVLDDQLVYDGDQVITFHRTLDQYPVLAREGAIIPLDGKSGSDIPNGCPTPESIEILLVVGADGSYDLIEDDGSGADITDVTFSTTPIRYSQAEATLTIGPTEKPLLERREYSVRLLASSAEGSKVSVDGFEVDTSSSDGNLIHIGSQSTSSTITVSIGNGNGQKNGPCLVSGDRKAQIFDRLGRAHMELMAKERVWNAVKGLGKEPTHKVMSRLNAIDADEDIKRVVLEIILADSSSV